MTREEAIKRYDRIRYNLLNHEDKEAVDFAFDALKKYDALLAEIKDMCFLCRHWNNGSGDKLCESCDDEDNFEWRGAQKEET